MSNNMGFEKLVGLFEQTQTAMQAQAARSVDTALVIRNWLFGLYIVEFEQNGTDRAEYGAKFIPLLAERLKPLKIRGTSTTQLKLFRSFYKTFPVKSPTLSDLFKNSPQISPTASDQLVKPEAEIKQLAFLSESTFAISDTWVTLCNEFKLGWSHYVVLLTIKSEEERRFYEIEALENSWGIRELKRQISSSLYERLALSRDKIKVKELSENGQLVRIPKDILKSPYVLEFLDLKEHSNYSEHELETANCKGRHVAHRPNGRPRSGS